jgi:beta-galactosidase
VIKTLFDADWQFTADPVPFLGPQPQWQPVHLPHDAAMARPRGHEYPTSGGGGYAWSGVVSYRKTLAVPEEWRDGPVLLEFEGVYMGAEVSVNRQLAALHPYGYTGFFVDLAPYLNYGGDNTITVTANNAAQPNSRWYSGTGIYRHVWLRRAGALHIAPWGVFVTTPAVDAAASTVSVRTEIAVRGAAATAGVLRATVLDADGHAVAQAETPFTSQPSAGAIVEQELRLADARLWSVDAPYLYTLVSEVLSGGRVVDRETTPFGLRTISADAEHGFRLNGVPLKLKGGCVHHDNGLLGAASYDRAEERKIELMKAAGYNAIRCAHNPPAPAMLDACDRLGMLVIDETFDCWRMGKNPHDYHLYFEDWWQRDTAAMVLRDRNHPSVIIWSIGNEVPERTGVSEGYAWCRRQAAYVRALDPTRLVTSALPDLFEEAPAEPGIGPELLFDPDRRPPIDPAKDRWGQVTREFLDTLDVGGYNYLHYRYAYDGERYPGRVICGTETFPHQAYVSWEATRTLAHVIGDFVWTSWDYLGESGIGRVGVDEPDVFMLRDPWPYHLANCGDIDICGFKRPQSYYRDILWGVRHAPYIGVLPPELHGHKVSFNPWGWEPVIDSWTFPGWEGKPTRADVYCAGDEVELLLNGVSLGRQPAGAAARNKAAFELTYAPGELVAVAYVAGRETGRTRLATAGQPAALRLTADRPAMRAAYGDLIYVTVEVVDAAGAVVRHAADEITCAVAGAAELAAIGAAAPYSEELYVGNRRQAFEGRLMAVVRSSGEPGEIRLAAEATGLRSAEIVLRAE